MSDRRITLPTAEQLKDRTKWEILLTREGNKFFARVTKLTNPQEVVGSSLDYAANVAVSNALREAGLVTEDYRGPG